VDLLSIIRGFWRRRIPATIIILLTLLGGGAVAFLVPPTHSVTAYLVMLNPPPPLMTLEDRQAHPQIAKLDSNNPFLRFSDPSVVVELLVQKMDDERVRQELKALGADEDYVVAADNRYGLATPIMNVTAATADPKSALKTVSLVSARTARVLYDLQRAQDVDPYYMIKVNVANMPDRATVQASSTLRALVAVLALGGLSLLLMFSMMQALDRFREERGSAPAPADIPREEGPSAEEGVPAEDAVVADDAVVPDHTVMPDGATTPQDTAPDDPTAADDTDAPEADAQVTPLPERGGKVMTLPQRQATVTVLTQAGDAEEATPRPEVKVTAPPHPDSGVTVLPQPEQRRPFSREPKPRRRLTRSSKRGR
jgi:hypothetical protein